MSTRRLGGDGDLRAAEKVDAFAAESFDVFDVFVDGRQGTAIRPAFRAPRASRRGTPAARRSSAAAAVAKSPERTAASTTSGSQQVALTGTVVRNALNWPGQRLLVAPQAELQDGERAVRVVDQHRIAELPARASRPATY